MYFPLKNEKKNTTKITTFFLVISTRSGWPYRNYTTNRIINRVVKNTCIRSFCLPFSVKRFSLFSVSVQSRRYYLQPVSPPFLPFIPWYSRSLLHARVHSFLILPLRSLSVSLSLRKALINPREPASNKFRLEREKQQIWVRWCQLRRMRATSYLSYFSARLLWLLRYYGELLTRTCTHKYVHTYVLRVYVRTDNVYMYKVFQKCWARFGMSIIFWIVTVAV